MDTNEYRKRVLSPFRRGRRAELIDALKDLQDGAALPSSLDLVFLYDIAKATTDAEHADQVAEVVDCWKKSINNQNYRDLAPQLTALHEQLRSKNPDLSTANFWKKAAEHQKRAARKHLDRFGAMLQDEYRAVGVITPELLQAAAVSVGGIDQLSERELVEAAEKAGIALVQPFNVPDITLPAGLAELQRTRCRSLIDAIYLDQTLTGFKIVDRFEAEGAAPLTLAQVAASRAELDRRAGGEAHNEGLIKVLGALATAAKAPGELHHIVLRHFVERVKESRSSLAGLSVQQLVTAGVDPVDAGRIVLQVGGRSETAGPQYVEERLLAGELREARRIYDLIVEPVVPPDPELARLGARITAAEEQVTRLRAEAQEAARSGDVERAVQALTHAVGLAGDDEHLAEALHALPPAAPVNVVVSPVDDSNDVRILWSSGFGSSGETRYRVVRKTGSAPRDARDGILLADGIEATQHVDPGPPPGVEHWYGISATRGGAPSVVTAARIVHLPPVLGLGARTTPTSAVLAWSTPSGATGVEIIQIDRAGTRRPLGEASAGSAEATGLETGQPYSFQVTACYRDPSGAEQRSAPRTVAVTPREPAEPLRMLNVEPVASTDGQLTVRASWRGGSARDVEVWQFATAPAFAYGTRIPMSQVRIHGTELVGDRIARGARRLLTATVPPGLRYYVPFTRDGDAGIAGPMTELGLCPPVTSAAATRYGNEVVVSWTWPDESFDVCASWETDEATGERTMSPSQYRTESGLHVRIGPGPATIRLRTQITRAADRWSSPEIVLDVAGASAVISYQVGWSRKLIGSASKVSFSFSSTDPVDADVVIVAARGRYLPISSDQGMVLQRTHVTVTDPVMPHLVEVPLSGLGKEYWVRAFPSNPTLLRVDDPPSSQLKGR